MIDWFWMLFAVFGLIQMLSGICGWTWWWKLAKGFYLPDLVGWRRTRLIYALSGLAMFWIGFSFFLQSLNH